MQNIIYIVGRVVILESCEFFWTASLVCLSAFEWQQSNE